MPFQTSTPCNAEGQLVTEWLLRRLGDTGDGKKARPGVGRPVEPPVVGHPQNGGP